MAEKEKYLSVKQAAERKGCSRQTIYNALERDELNREYVASYYVIVMDNKWRQWEPQTIFIPTQKKQKDSDD